MMVGSCKKDCVHPAPWPSMRPLIAVAAFACVTLQSVAQSAVYFEPHTGYFEHVDLNNPGRFAKSADGPHQIIKAGGAGAKASNFTWNVTYGDITANNNLGFDAPDPEGAARRARVEDALTYIASVLNTAPSPVIDIEVNVSQTDGTGALASAGSFWFTSPPRFDGGLAQIHILTGTDPSGSTADITLTVDFGYTWNTGTGAPVAGEFDLLSVLIHEFTHGLGFAGLSTSAGISSISISDPGVFSLLTQGFERSDGTPLWAAGGDFIGLAADLISDDVVFDGTNARNANGGAAPKIYSPNPFEAGSSLSHVDTATFPSAVMKHAIADGTTTRAYTSVEIGIIQDIGFSTASSLAEVPPTDAPANGVFGSAVLIALFVAGGIALWLRRRDARSTA